VNFRAPRNDEFELNVTPLIDVVLAGLQQRFALPLPL
jgi:biopolymer transport protein ExbD